MLGEHLYCCAGTSFYTTCPCAVGSPNAYTHLFRSPHPYTHRTQAQRKPDNQGAQGRIIPWI